jgi:hypothetical protein
MNIEITEVRRSSADVEVAFTSICGSARARWVGEAPQVGDRKSVEFDADDTLTLGENARVTDGAEPALRERDGTIELTARLQAHYTDEETVSLAFADGRIELEVSDAAGWEVDQWYSLRLTTLSAFDTNV